MYCFMVIVFIPKHSSPRVGYSCFLSVLPLLWAFLNSTYVITCSVFS